MFLFKGRRHRNQAIKKFAYQQQQQQQDMDVAKTWPFFKFFIFLIIFLILSLGALFWSKLNNFQVEKIKIVANYKHVRPKLLRNIVGSFVQNNFFDMDMLDLRQRLLQLPWVYAVSVQRKWPNTVVVNVVEQQPAARWKKNALLNAYGQLFIPSKATFPAGLPVLSGPNDQAQQIFQDYQFIQKTLAPLQFKILRLGLEVPNSWHLVLSNGLNLYLNGETYLEQLQNFVKVYPKIVSTNPNGTIQTVDLRYSNGMAVKWE